MIGWPQLTLSAATDECGLRSAAQEVRRIAHPVGAGPPYAPCVSRWSWVAVVAAASLIGAAACSSGAGDAAPVVRPHWREVTLPALAGPAGRVLLRDAAACGATWYVVGAIAGSGGSTRPAAWTSTDAVGLQGTLVVADPAAHRLAVVPGNAAVDAVLDHQVGEVGHGVLLFGQVLEGVTAAHNLHLRHLFSALAGPVLQAKRPGSMTTGPHGPLLGVLRAGGAGRGARTFNRPAPGL